MIKNILLGALLLGTLAIWTKQLYAMFGSVSIPDNNKVVVLELFTSQSCSSCPPADRLLSQLAEKENVIALSCHVTYWNHLHWEDTLSHQFCTDRQYAYAQPLGEGRRVFTPQLVVNGASHAIGSQPGAINTAIKRTNQAKKITVTRQNDALLINLPQISADNYRISLFGIKKEHTQGIKRGENRGRTVTYTNSVSYSEHIETSAHNLREFTIRPQQDAEGYIILVQDPDTMHVLAAGQAL